MKKTAWIDPGKCVGCGACISRCPAGAIRMQPGWKSCADPQKCTGCGTCVGLCHRHAPLLRGADDI